MEEGEPGGVSGTVSSARESRRSRSSLAGGMAAAGTIPARAGREARDAWFGEPVGNFFPWN